MKSIKTGALCTALAALSTGLALGAAETGKNVSNALTRGGNASVHNAKSGSALDIRGEIRREPEIDAHKGGTSQARIPATGVPRPAGNGLASLDAGFLGFPGVNHLQQRLGGQRPSVFARTSIAEIDQDPVTVAFLVNRDARTDGSFWFTAQCTLGGPRTFYANWSTFIGKVSF